MLASQISTSTHYRDQAVSKMSPYVFVRIHVIDRYCIDKNEKYIKMKSIVYDIERDRNNI